MKSNLDFYFSAKLVLCVQAHWILFTYMNIWTWILLFGDSIYIDTIDIDAKPIDGVRSMGDDVFFNDFYKFECQIS